MQINSVFFPHNLIEAVKARENIDTLREQYDNSVREYDKLNDEHRKLQVTERVFVCSSL